MKNLLWGKVSFQDYFSKIYLYLKEKNIVEDRRKKRVHIYVSGRVQGVYYRQTTLKVAGEIGVFGWVRNTMDGRVEAVFEGDEEKVDKIVEWCKQGPSMASVTNISLMEEKYENEFHDFRVKHTI